VHEMSCRVVGVGLIELDYAVTMVAVRYQRVTVAILQAGHVSTCTLATCTSVVLWCGLL
jgi:hypothetical protein